jgi:cathepsin B
MKYLLLVLVFCYVAYSRLLVQNDYIINKVNSANAGWVAGYNEVFKGKTLREVQHMLGTFLVVPETDRLPLTTYGIGEKDLPVNFDSEKQWPQCTHPIRNQLRCGSCWAFSAAEALTDRFCIATKGAINVILSPQDMVSCDRSNYGCQGGYLTNTWRYLENTGVVSDQCLPYKSGGGSVPPCPNKCDSPSLPWKKYRAKSGTMKHFGSVASAQQDIMSKGPIQAGFSVYQDFFSYKSGVYHHVSGGLAGGHAVKVNGWGVTAQGQAYWIVANSWGNAWGMNGYFWIRRGNNECNFDRQLYVSDAMA